MPTAPTSPIAEVEGRVTEVNLCIKHGPLRHIGNPFMSVQVQRLSFANASLECFAQLPT